MGLLNLLGLKKEQPAQNLDLGIGLPQPNLSTNDPVHKGLFGQKGALRDVMGLLGDAFLLQGGHKQQYFPKRAQEKLSDSLIGFDEDPMAALSRAFQVDPGAASELSKVHYQNQQAQSVAQKNAAAVAAQDAERVAAMVASAAGKPGSWKALYPQAKAYAEAKGVPFNLSPDATDEELTAWAQTAMEPKDIFAQRETQRAHDDLRAYRQGTLGVQQQNADSNRRRTVAYEGATKVGNASKVAGAYGKAASAYGVAGRTSQVGKPKPSTKSHAVGPIFHQRGVPFQRYSDGSTRYAGPTKEIPGDEEE